MSLSKFNASIVLFLLLFLLESGTVVSVAMAAPPTGVRETLPQQIAQPPSHELQLPFFPDIVVSEAEAPTEPERGRPHELLRPEVAYVEGTMGPAELFLFRPAWEELRLDDPYPGRTMKPERDPPGLEMGWEGLLPEEGVRRPATVHTAQPYAPSGVVRYVATTGDDSGNDCTNSASPCATVQHAVDVANTGDEIRVAAGTYTGVNSYAGLSQVVYISKTVAIRGGYTTTDWTTPDPAANPTVLDAQRQGRVLYISGNITPTIEGLRMTGGDTSALGSYVGGGGVCIFTAKATISDCHIYSNTASYGGGVYLWLSDATLSGNTIVSNTASYNGGGAYLSSSDATLSGNTIVSNTASRGGGVYLYLSSSDATLSGNTIVSNTASRGGGLCLDDSDATLNGNMVQGNAADIIGGGVYLFSSDATLSGNTITSNTASYGGGLYLGGSAATLSGNTIMSNTASSYGGGLYLGGSAATLGGNTIVSNTASSYGGGVYLSSSDATLSGNTVQGNTASRGGGVYLFSSDATLSGNTITSNTASDYGGGVYLSSSDATLSGNTVQANTASYGGGVYLVFSAATLDNNLVADNSASSGGGFYVYGSSPTLRHPTLARNEGQGVYVTNSGHVVLTNTILVSHTVGISVTAGSTATLQATLWGNGNWANTTDWGGDGNITIGAVNLWADPGFVDPAHGDYHILSTSAAVDAGVDSGVTTDIDGDIRPCGNGYDIGADEYWICVALTDTSISGPTVGYTDTAYSFAATVTPPTATLPITYTWTPTPTAGSGAVVTYSWAAPGVYTVTVRAENCGGVVTATHTITIESPCPYPLSGVTITGPTAGYTDTAYSFAATVTPPTATAPITYIWTPTPTAGSGAVVTYTWAVPGVYTITVTAENCGGVVTATHTITIESPCPYPLSGVTITGPTAGYTDTAYSFAATVTPPTATTPITYTWTPTPTAGSGAVVTYSWAMPGVYTITVRAENCGGVVTATHTITIESPCPYPLSGVTIAGPTVGYTDTAYSFAATVTPPTATAPTTYTWTPTPTAGSGAVVTYSWAVPGVYTITVRAENCGGVVTATHTITIESPCPYPLSGVTIAGPTAGYTDTAYSFAATVAPSDATLPITYTWTPTPTAGSGAVVTYSWAMPGVYTITVRAENCGGVVTATHTITITAPPTLVKSVVPTGAVSYGDELTYTLVISGAPGASLGLYDPLSGTTFLRFVEPVTGVVHSNGVITGTVTLTPTSPVTVSFVVRVGVPGTAGWTVDVSNRACVYPAGGTLGECVWSNEVTNRSTRPEIHAVYLPLVLRER